MTNKKKLKDGERETVNSQYGTYERYFLSEDELKKYQELPPDSFWDKNSKPIMPPGTLNKKRGA
ncbi:hypothetical protein P4H66_19585 [Paenibacillus dokdonensis]|uniref:Uncharacterized protein n=1 Tax=Paenibacillus dokdonensis TaxID=2567944 RepID=A0ABU6GRM7_9BACL|nr:hypothetical protein [Paenibacillus dokdonensis]MEC0242009.1 hypothetical protein [Paenibacillus dokdonensis]